MNLFDKRTAAPSSEPGPSRRKVGMGALALAGAHDRRFRAETQDVYFVRHAESEVNVAIDPGQPDSGVSYPLTKLGIVQAREMARQVTAAGPPGLLYASNLLRAVQTADAIAFRAGTPVHISPALREVEFGEVDAGPTLAASLAAIRAIYMAWLAGDRTARAKGGESFAEVRDRVHTFVDHVLATASAGAPIVIVSHRATLMVTGPEIFSNVTPAFAAAHPIPNCGLIHGRLVDGRLECQSWLGVEPKT